MPVSGVYAKPAYGKKNWNKEIDTVIDETKADFNTLQSELDAAELEIQNARGNLASLAARLGVSINDDGTLKAGSTVAVDWKTSGYTPTYISANSFSIPTDVTAEFIRNRRLNLTLTGGAVYSAISSAVFSTVTTITLKDSVLDNTLSAVSYGIVSPGTAGSLPDIPEIYLNTSNIFRAFEEIQENHGGSLLMEAGWSDSFANPNEQGADEANSTNEQHDNTNKLYKGTDGGTGLFLDENFTTESNYNYQKESLSDVSVSGDVVTLNTGTLGANVANGRIIIGANEANIVTRDSNTQLTVESGHSLSGTNVTAEIRFHKFDSGIVKLNQVDDPGNYGPDLTNGKTITHDGTLTSGVIGNAIDDNTGTSVDFDSTDGYPRNFTIDFSASKKITQLVMNIEANGRGQNVSFNVTGSHDNITFSAALFSTTNKTFAGGSGSSDTFALTNSTAYRYYKIEWTASNNGSGLPQTYEIEMMEDAKANVINEYVPIFPTFANLTDAAPWSDENSLAQTETLNSANAWYFEIFAKSSYGAGTKLKITDGASGNIREIVQNSSGTWQYNSNATYGSTTWTNATANTMIQAIIDAMGVAANQMTGTNRAATPDSAALLDNSTYRGTGMVLYSTVNTNNPEVDQTRIGYDSVRAAMDIRSKNYDPGFIPIEAYLWCRAEHSSADGPGTFSVSRDGGTTWSAVTMTQQGEPITGNQKILRGTIDISGQPPGQDIRCRYVTDQNKNQYLHSWGLQAKS